MRTSILLLSAAAFAASAVIASGTQADRRAAMKSIGAASKAIRNNQDVATNAQVIVDNAAQIPLLFAVNEITGDSEAKPEIWSNFDDFSAKGAALEAAAQALVDAAANGGDVAAAAGALGNTCRDCHQSYKS